MTQQLASPIRLTHYANWAPNPSPPIKQSRARRPGPGNQAGARRPGSSNQGGARRVGPERADLLLTALRDVLREALDHDGTTLRDYRTVDGGTGSNQYRLDCYGRAGSPCARCRTPLTSRLLDQRTATWCPSCQAR